MRRNLAAETAVGIAAALGLLVALVRALWLWLTGG
jgi:hypothetical protein